MPSHLLKITATETSSGVQVKLQKFKFPLQHNQMHTVYVTWSDKKGLIAQKYMCSLNSVYLHKTLKLWSKFEGL